jgi:hypothetical protein
VPIRNSGEMLALRPRTPPFPPPLESYPGFSIVIFKLQI